MPVSFEQRHSLIFEVLITVLITYSSENLANWQILILAPLYFAIWEQAKIVTWPFLQPEHFPTGLLATWSPNFFVICQSA